MIRNRSTANHAIWGDGCDAWELLAGPALSVKHERMPPGTREIRHHHMKAEQFFFVLAGELVMEVEGASVTLRPQEGISVPAGQRHQAINQGPEPSEFLVVSAPSTIVDRIEEP